MLSSNNAVHSASMYVWYIQYVFMCDSSFPASPLCVCRTDDVSSDFTLRGLSVQSIHGDRSAVDPLEHMRLCQSLCSVLFCREQYDREQALDDFKTGTVLCKFLLFGVVGVL